MDEGAYDDLCIIGSEPELDDILDDETFGEATHDGTLHRLAFIVGRLRFCCAQQAPGTRTFPIPQEG